SKIKVRFASDEESGSMCDPGARADFWTPTFPSAEGWSLPPRPKLADARAVCASPHLPLSSVVVPSPLRTNAYSLPSSLSPPAPVSRLCVCVCVSFLPPPPS
ncbi:unnamed protein product, partial [Scytosiphon promiscuus]